MVKHFPREDVEALQSMVRGDYKKRHKELMEKGACIYKPQTNCDKNYECIKRDDAHEAYMKSHRRERREGKNPFARHTTLFATDRPGFVCPDKVPNNLKKLLETD